MVKYPMEAIPVRRRFCIGNRAEKWALPIKEKDESGGIYYGYYGASVGDEDG